MLNEETLEQVEQEQAKYPHPKTGIIHALFIAQDEKNYILEEDVEQMAEVMDLDASEIWSVASFYTMINQEPVGKYKVQVCDNLPCLVEGAAEIVDHLESRLGIEDGETTPDELFTLETVECLGSCGTGPLCQINDGPYHENLTIEDIDELIDDLREQETVEETAETT
jgi:NADH-quinone oxidoreductase subunit E